jgi:hypothetical protein
VSESWRRPLPPGEEDLDESADCDGMCVTAADVGVPEAGPDAVAYAHPGCPRHDPGSVCGCGQPDRCMSPTHGQISMSEALAIRHRQDRGNR